MPAFVSRTDAARSISAVVAVAVLLAIALAAPGRVVFADPLDVGAMSVEEAARLRTELGLSGDHDLVRLLMQSDGDVGTPLWGIPMTAAEERLIDLPGRMAFADHVDMTVDTYVEGLATYAGLYFEPENGGRLTIMLTTDDAETSRTIAELMPPERPWRIVTRPHTYQQLQTASSRAASLVAPFDPTAVVWASPDIRGNGVLIRVLTHDFRLVERNRAALERELGVPIVLRQASYEVPSHCDTRIHCHSPMRAGISMGIPDYGGCTMGVHIERNSIGDRQLTTAGHCGYGKPTGPWEHAGYHIGYQQQSLYRQNGYDIMRVSLAANQESLRIFGDNRQVIGHGTPLNGEHLCASVWVSNTIKCGTVTDTYFSYNFGPAWGNYTIYGADLSTTTTQGDSGGPVYRGLNSSEIRVIGVMSSVSGAFARLDFALDDFASHVFH